MGGPHIGWLGIVRLGLVQMALGAIVVITTSTLNRVMVVELALPAVLPGALVALHHVMQLLRPRMGHGSDVGRRCTPFINGGMAALGAGGVLAATGTALMKGSFLWGLLVAVVGFVVIGAGVSAAGTSLLVLLAKRVAPERRPAAATIVWMMMIAGFAITSTLAGKQLDPFSPARLVSVTATISLLAVLVTLVATIGVEGAPPLPAATPAPAASASHGRPDFAAALREVWAEPDARTFTVFVFVSMLAYSAQDLILEPFAGSHFRFTPGESTRLSGTQHGGVFAGMLLVAFVTTVWKGRPLASLKGWVIGGTISSAVALSGLVAAGLTDGPWPLSTNVFLLGVANGAFSIAAIGGMMALAGAGRGSREGVRMGLWGASQAIAFGAGGFLGTVLADAARWLTGATSGAYAFVFGLEVVGFVAATALAQRIAFGAAQPSTTAAVDALMGAEPDGA